MAPTSADEPAVKHITLHQFLKQQHLLQQRLKPSVVWSWPATASPAAGRGDADGKTAAADDDGLGGTWPPRSYTCAFCRREFRSAQALGGHMNVHRRDRAKMRAHAAAAQLGGAGSAAEAPAAAAAAEYAVFYPILNSNAAGAVLIPRGDVLLAAPMALAAAAAAHDHQCHACDDENENEIDLELRLWWPDQ